MELLVVVASTRPGRVGITVADWFIDRAREHGGFDVRVADLKEIDLPLFDEPVHPRLQRYDHQHTKDWSAQVASADAFVFVMPEYNFSFNAALKNAVDYLNAEWAYKPVAFVSYGGISGGLRAVAMIKQVVSALRMTPVTDAVTVPMVSTMIEDGAFRPTQIVADSTEVVLDELVRMAAALAPLRSESAAHA